MAQGFIIESFLSNLSFIIIKIIFVHFRELTEPECDRDITEFTTLQAQIRNQLEKIREQDIVKPAGISRQNSWNTANQRHLEEKFVIKV